MKSAQLLVVALAVFASASLAAQQTDPAAPRSTAGDANAPAPIQMSPVSGELVGKLDAKSAKVGDRVEIRAKEPAKTADGTAIPRGAKLVGHITAVQARAAGSDNSELAIQFDRVELKGGQSFPIQAAIMSIAPQPVAAAAGDDPFGGPVMGGSLSPTSGARPGGGGMLAPGQMPPQTGMGSAKGRVDTSQYGAAELANQQSTTTHATSVPGVMLAVHPGASASSTLSSLKKNVHLDDGTLIVLGVAVAR